MEISEIVNECKSVFDNVTECLSTDAYKDMFKANAFIAGGAIASLSCTESPKDWDFYFRDRETYNMVCNHISMIEMNDRAATANISGDIVQFINMNYGTPDEIIEGFDFEHCKVYYTRDDNSLGWLEDREPLITSKHKNLVYEGGFNNIISTMSRLVKFTSRGWSIDAESFANLLKDINAFTGEVPDEVEVHSNYRGKGAKKSRRVGSSGANFTIPRGLSETLTCSSESMEIQAPTRRSEPVDRGRPVIRREMEEESVERESSTTAANDASEDTWWRSHTRILGTNGDSSS